MTATLDAATSARVAAGPSHWRTRILPPTDGRGGWTMKPGSPVGSQRAAAPGSSSELGTVAASTPKRRRFCASQT